ncbi:MAG: DUF5063 domain-containing protein [Gammaproteobacteria bacterium]|nr:MAG: DUF5063 domain-containing protein [Gammaproteobacteria bacterium]RLA24204.1 MAG: DUF5063 domain-containing protein [Gammaproteobacteria bacterium]
MISDPFKFQALASAANDFCQLIENIKKLEESEWLFPITQSLAQLHATVLQFDSGGIDYRFFTLPDLDDRFELFFSLKLFLKEQDSYPLERDLSTDSVGTTGSLADDFADIYFELKRGLNLLDAGVIHCEEEALKLWQSGFILHWGQHLVDAQRHLYRLRIQEIYLTVPTVRAR